MLLVKKVEAAFANLVVLGAHDSLFGTQTVMHEHWRSAK